MKATAELQVIPLGNGIPVRQQVTRVVEMPGARGFTIETHASGTHIEGELEAILHAAGEVRLITCLKLETRTDKTPTLAGKRL